MTTNINKRKNIIKAITPVLIIALLISSASINPTLAASTIDPGYSGQQDGGSQSGGRKLDTSVPTSPYMGFYNAHEETVLTLVDGSGKIIGSKTVPNSDMGQNATWEDAYYLAKTKTDGWNEDLQEHQDWKVEFEVQTVYNIYTYSNEIIGYDEKGRALYPAPRL